MAELVNTIEKLKALPPELHWFCPRSGEDDSSYFDEDLGPSSREETEEEKIVRVKRVKEAQDRRHLVQDACQVLAFNDAQEYQDALKKMLCFQLGRCDVCVREYHRGRAEIVRTLGEQYEADAVSQFLGKYDHMNFARICAGLDSAAAKLDQLDPRARGVSAIPSEALYAFYEALHCDVFLRNEDLLHSHFDTPFALVQTSKMLRLPTYVPAMTCFLFSTNNFRGAWAKKSWAKVKAPMTGASFDWNVRDFLSEAMNRVTIAALEVELQPLFWSGARIILGKLNKDIITHHLRAMELDICTLALQHLVVDSSGFLDLLKTVQILLETSPTDFWEAMGTIPASTIVEQVFGSPSMKRLLANEDDKSADMQLAALTWIEPLVASIKPTNLIPACRALANQLMSETQKNKCSRFARASCWERGLKVIAETLKRMVQTASQGTFVGGATVEVMGDLVRQYLDRILPNIDTINGIDPPNPSVRLGLLVINLAVQLDCVSLRVDRRAIIEQTQPMKPDARSKKSTLQVSVSNLGVLKAAVRGIKYGNLALPLHVLSGLRELLGLEKFTAKQIGAGSPVLEQWNHVFTSVTQLATELLDSLSNDFEPEMLEDLVAVSEFSHSLFAALFSGSSLLHEAAVAVLKTYTMEDNRRDATMHCVKAFFQNTMSSVAQVLLKVFESKAYSPAATTLKLCGDLVDCLCNSQDGVLRSRTLEGREEVAVTENAWRCMWKTLSTMFATTESWSAEGYASKEDLQEFCRNTMDFADQLFEQYSTFASALSPADLSDAGGRDSSDNIGRRLLEQPKQAMKHIVKWLRLRDEWLIEKSVSMICKMLIRLHEVAIEVPLETCQFIEDIVLGENVSTGQKVRSNLSRNQKAELERALNIHMGEDPSLESPEVEVVLQRPHKQKSLSDWVAAGSSTSTQTENVTKKKQGIDFGSWEASAKARKELNAAEHEAELNKLVSETSSTFQALKAQRDGRQAKTSVAGPATKRAAQEQKIDPAEFMRKRKEEMEALRKSKAAVAAAAKRSLPNSITGEAGSGLNGLGVHGKDHNTKGNSVMVDSDEESSDDDDDGLDKSLFGIDNTKKKPAIAGGMIGSTVPKVPLHQGPTKIKKVVRSAKDMRARLTPDASPLHKEILSWDFFAEGDFPPSSVYHQYKKVENSFRTYIDYQNTFRPLLVLEAWNNFIRSREENTFKPYQIKLAGRTSVDQFIEVSSTVAAAETKDNQVLEGDIVLFSKAANPTEAKEVAHCLARVHRVQRKKGSIEILYRLASGNPLLSFLSPGNILYGAKIQSIIPLEREFGALQGLQYFDLLDEIIRARPSNLLNYSEKQLQPVMATYSVNKAQAKAVKSAIDNDAFTLIQGPPGSGKTKVIVAIVGALLSDSLGDTTATRIEMPRNVNGGFSSTARHTTKKLLVCAPSNAAVDELVMRFKEGIKTLGGRHKTINVVRIGRSDNINKSVLDVTLEELVNRKLGTTTGDNKSKGHTQELMQEHKKISDLARAARDRLDSGQVKGAEASALQDDFNNMKTRQKQLGTQIDAAKDAETAANRNADLSRKRAQQAVLDGAHIICGTLSGTGHEMFQNLNIEFETVVVDEAAQCVEVNSLIPLKYGCSKCILVGDPKQLPPTVFSRDAARFSYEQSLFVRMQTNFPDSVHLLDTQYRMHPDISFFPSRAFYDGRLLDGKNMAVIRKQPWHSSTLLAPYRFFDVQGQHQTAKGHSLVNIAEIDVAMGLYDRLTNDYQSYDFTAKVGIITPYKSQLRELKARFERRYGMAIYDIVEFNTTDAFQGRESEIIIFSCVRASPAGGIGFLSDIRRMNVGLTRAKSSLWVLGNSTSLVRGEYFKMMVEDAQKRKAYSTGNLIDMLRMHSGAFPAEGGVQSKSSGGNANNHTSLGLSRERISASIHAPRSSAFEPVKAPDRPMNNPSGPSSRNLSSNPPSKPASNPQSNPPSGPRSVTSHPSARGTPETNGTGMEGVRYRLEDRLPRKNNPERQPDRLAPGTDGDTEMYDANSDNPSDTTGTTTADEGNEAPLSKGFDFGTFSANNDKAGAQRDGMSRTSQVSGATAPPLPVKRKRKETNIFMTKKAKPG
ncbi:DEAD-box type RNA helicase [Elasticomyces elasticus]|nr:DEAD-box type RNA helicase [Elasticomyces elasticus]